MFTSTDTFEPAESATPPTTNQLDFEQWCVPLYSELVNFARRLASGDSHRAADVVQDSLVRALRAWHRFTPDEHALSTDHAVRGWLYLIVRNTFIGHYHSDRRRRGFILDNRLEPPAQLQDQWVNPEESSYEFWSDDLRHAQDPRVTMDREPGDEVAEAIASLPPHHRRVVEMFYLQGAGVDDIARELGVARKTVHTRLFRAREALRRKLQDFAVEVYGLRGAEQDPVKPPQRPHPKADRVERVVARDDRREFEDADSAPQHVTAW